MISKLITIIGSSMLVFGMVVGIPSSTKAETVKVTNDGSFVLAQTNGMERRQDRRDTRQDCRQDNGAVGQDKRNCKQQGRQNNN
jgi:hypothetical protein